MEDSGDPALRMRLSEEQANRSRQDITTAGSLSTARFIAQGLADLANRAAVVFYTIDLRGLVSFALTAADSPSSNPTRANRQSQ